MYRIYIVLICCCFSKLLFAQDQATNERKQINSLFKANLLRSSFRDTNMVYMFAFKVKVDINKKGEAKVQSVAFSDPVVNRLYKDLNFLREIHYNLFTGPNRTAIFVFPVCILLEYPCKPNAGFVNMQDLQQKMENYWFRKDYSAEPTENYIYIPVSVLRTSIVESY